jgi:hypothetical protein
MKVHGKIMEMDMKWSKETQGHFKETRYVRLIPRVVGSELYGHFVNEVSTKSFVPVGTGISNVRCRTRKTTINSDCQLLCSSQLRTSFVILISSSASVFEYVYASFNFRTCKS